MLGEYGDEFTVGLADAGNAGTTHGIQRAVHRVGSVRNSFDLNVTDSATYWPIDPDDDLRSVAQRIE